MKKIALYISSFKKGGAERVMSNLAEYFRRKEYEVILVTQYVKENEYELSPDLKRIISEPEESDLQGNRIQNFIARFRALRNVWKEEKPDVVLAFLGKNNLMAIGTAMFLPVKVAVSVRGEPTMEYMGKTMQLIAKFVFRYADGVVFQTNQARAFFGKKVQKKSIVLGNPLSESFVNRPRCYEKESLIVSAGRLDENKNFEMLIRAFAKMDSEYSDTRLVIYGEGANRKNLESLISELKMEDRISLPGNVTDVASMIEKGRIFVLCSNTEGMPNALMEAMALGLAVVSTDCPCGGPAELIRNGENGLLVPVGDEDSLKEAIEKILLDKLLEKKMGDCAFQIRSTHEPGLIYAKWEQFLSEL